MIDISQSYKILGLKTSASSVEVKQAYRSLAKQWHPDRFINKPELIVQAQAKFKEINRAYEVVKNHSKNYKTNDNSKTQVKTNKSSAEYYYQQGVQLAEGEKYKEAISQFDRAIKLDSNYVKAYQYRGFIFSKLGYEHRADADFKKVAKIKLEANQNYNNSNSSDRDKVNSNRDWRCVYNLLAHQEAVSCLNISKDNNFFVSGSTDGSIKLWNLKIGQYIKTFKAHKNRINCLSLSQDNKTIISGSKDKTIRLWNLKTGKIIATLGSRFSGHQDSILKFVLDSNKNTLTSFSIDKNVKVWDLDKRKEIKSFDYNSAQITCIAIDPKKGIFCSGGLEKQLRIRNFNTGKVIRSLRGDSGVLSLAFSHDGNILAAGGFNRNIQLWDLKTGKIISTLIGHQDRISSLIFSYDAQTLISGSWDSTIKFWDIKTAKCSNTLNGHKKEISHLAISNNDRTIISSSVDGCIKIWQK